MGQIQYVGLEGLDAQDKEIITRLTSEYSGRIQRIVRDDIRIVLQIKSNSKQGSKKKWGFHMRVISPKLSFEIKKAHDWDLARAVHETLNAAMDRAKKLAKSEDPVWKTKERNLKKGGILGALFGMKRRK